MIPSIPKKANLQAILGNKELNPQFLSVASRRGF